MSELETFVTGYLERVGAIIEPASPEVYEVLLPDDIARQWEVPAYSKIAFAETEPGEDATRLGYNHSLVDEMVEGARAHPSSTRYYINNLRLSKSGLTGLARENWGLLNSRVVEIRRATIGRVRCTYVRFNFKVALLSDEKQERLVSILMDAHTGYVAAEPETIERMANNRQPDATLKTLPDAPLRWTAGDGFDQKDPLAQPVLLELLNRAQEAVLDQLAESLKDLQRRTGRFRELDEARLNTYYDDIEQDLKKRMRSASAGRREGLEEKLAAVATDREAKLADVVERYQVRLELTLLNLLIIAQPKLVLTVGIQNRATRIKNYAVYDPLLHRLEPLICAVCGLPSRRTYLCHNGHLVHTDCLAPACVDCKRVFCAHCAGEIGVCEVCDQPLCRHSRIACEVCGRGTCQAHIGMCHADEGKPLDLSAQTPTLETSESISATPAPETSPAAEVSPKKPAKGAASRKRPPKKAGVKKKIRKKTARRLPKGMPKPQQIQVVVFRDSVAAYLLASRERQLASRVWELDVDEGIVMTCQCEKKDDCPANDRVIWPEYAARIEKQIGSEIAKFRREYGLPPKKVHFNQAVGSSYVPMGRLTLYGLWKDDDVLSQARASFNRFYLS